MLKVTGLVVALCVSLAAPAMAQGPSNARGSQGPSPRRVALGDWPEARGPNRDGKSAETALPDSWELNGRMFLWRVPFGGRSAPIVMGNRVYVQNPSGRGPTLQERVMALDADSGKVIWEYKFNIFQSDVPPHRVGWASPAADPDTGNVYALGVGASLIALNREGKLLWQRSIGEEFAAFTTHGGRTMSPIIDGDLVIVSAAVSNWGAQANRAHRFIALNKRTGEIVYVANPGGRPYDTAYAAPTIATINGTRMLIAGLGDGAIHAIKAQTGEKVWSFVAAKRAINTGVVVSGNSVIISHGDENLTGNEMGMIAAIDGSQTGDIKAARWAHYGEQFGFSSPLVDGSRVYQIENGSRLKAYDIETGKELWTQPLGTSQKAPPVMADGKIFVGTENGKFFIVRPHADRAEILSEVDLPISKNSIGGSEGTEEQIFGGAAVSRGRVFFVSSDAVYAIGSKQPAKLTGWAVDEPSAAGEGAPAYLQVAPTELVLTPGQTVKLSARSFDSRGRFLREEKATWSLSGLKGTVVDGAFTVSGDRGEQAGLITATAGTLSPALAVGRNIRFDQRRTRARGLGECRWPSRAVGGRGRRRSESAAEDADEYAFQAEPRVHRAGRVGELHHAGRRQRSDATPDDGRRRHHGAALQPGAVRDDAAPEARAVGAGDAAVRRAAVLVEAGHVVYAQAASGKSGGRERPGTREGLAQGRTGTCPVADRQNRSNRQPSRGARVLP
jgi:outer membrane protein assembly factor BamB